MEEFKVMEWDEKRGKSEEIDKIFEELQALKQIEKDFSDLVYIQAQGLDNVENKEDEMIKETKEAGILLKDAAMIQTKSWKLKIATKFSALGAGIGMIVGPVGAVIGSAIGAISGGILAKTAEKINTNELEKINF